MKALRLLPLLFCCGLVVGCEVITGGYRTSSGGGGSSSGSSGSSGGTGSSGSSSGSIGTGCVADDGLDCSGGGTGITCPSGKTPDPAAGTCSAPSAMANGTDGFCCLPFSGCTADDALGCQPPAYGFLCTSGSPAPSADEAGLNCSSPTKDANGNDDYCCTN